MPVWLHWRLALRGAQTSTRRLKCLLMNVVELVAAEPLGLPGGPYLANGECSACGGAALLLAQPQPEPCGYIGCDRNAEYGGLCCAHATDLDIAKALGVGDYYSLAPRDGLGGHGDCAPRWKYPAGWNKDGTYSRGWFAVGNCGICRNDAKLSADAAVWQAKVLSAYRRRDWAALEALHADPSIHDNVLEKRLTEIDSLIPRDAADELGSVLKAELRSVFTAPRARTKA